MIGLFMHRIENVTRETSLIKSEKGYISRGVISFYKLLLYIFF